MRNNNPSAVQSRLADGNSCRIAGQAMVERGPSTSRLAQSPGDVLEDPYIALGGSDLIRSKPLIAAIARELWKLHGGNEVLNWIEAEILLENALGSDSNQAETSESTP